MGMSQGIGEGEEGSVSLNEDDKPVFILRLPAAPSDGAFFLKSLKKGSVYAKLIAALHGTVLSRVQFSTANTINRHN